MWTDAQTCIWTDAQTCVSFLPLGGEMSGSGKTCNNNAVNVYHEKGQIIKFSCPLNIGELFSFVFEV